jgi:hypothetical protein
MFRTLIPPANLVVGFVTLLLMGACDRSNAKLPGDEVVLARVEGEPVTRYDLDRAIERSLGRFATPAVAQRSEGNVLDSLLQSRVIAGVASKELSPVEKLELDKQVASYRENLLVRKYLERHAPVASVTPAMVEKYYKDHPERFGGSRAKAYQLLGSKREVVGAERIEVMKELQAASGSNDWKAAAEALEKKGLPVVFATGDVSSQLLHDKLRELLVSLPVGKASQLVFIQDRAYVARVTGERDIPPKPLSEVRKEIERALEPVQLRDAVKKVSDDLMAKAKVERLVPVGGVKPAAPGGSVATPSRVKPEDAHGDNDK